MPQIRSWSITVKAICLKVHRLYALISPSSFLCFTYYFKIGLSILNVAEFEQCSFQKLFTLCFIGFSWKKKKEKKFPLFLDECWRSNTGPGSPVIFLFPRDYSKMRQETKAWCLCTTFHCPFAPLNYFWFLESFQCSLSPLRSKTFHMIWFITMQTKCIVLQFLVFPV